jgi:DNA-binding transcriptional MocR family regulator
MILLQTADAVRLRPKLSEWESGGMLLWLEIKGRWKTSRVVAHLHRNVESVQGYDRAVV